MITPVNTKRFVRKCLKIRILLFLFFSLVFGLANVRSQVLTCPPDYTINLPQNLCAIFINYDTLDWSSTIPVFDPIYFPLEGTFLSTGVTEITLAATDGEGDFHTCNFEVNIVAFNSTTFTCPSQVSVSLEGQCERVVPASDVLDVNYFVCDQDYETEVLNENNEWVEAEINASQVNQSFNLRLTNTKTGHSCETIITVSGGEPVSITCPPNKVIYCNEPTDMDYIGAPALTGCFDAVDLTYSDNLIFTQCPNPIGFQIVRTFTAISPNGSQVVCNHLITANRFPTSLVEFPEDFDDVQNPALGCNDSMSLAEIAHPNIAGWPSVVDFPANGNPHCNFATSYIDNIIPICGESYEIRRAWTVVNLCLGQTRRDTQTILVLDQTPPFFEITDTVFFSNSGGCVDSVFLPSANLLAECSGFGFLIESPFGNAPQNGIWVHPDTLPGIYEVQYTLTDECGNDSTQVLILSISEETLVACPPNDTISCDLYYSVISPAIQSNNYQVLATLGLPSFYLNCSYDLTETDVADVDVCGFGTIERIITATNASDTLTCEQLITVQHVSDFEALFPQDTSLCTTPAQADLPEPQLFSINCEAVSVTFTDMIVPDGPSGCYNVLRTWYATNSCAFNGSESGSDTEVSPRRYRDNGDGRITYTQTIHVNNNAALTFPNGCEIPDLYANASNCSANFLVPIPVVEGCGQIILTVSGSLGNTLGSAVSVLPGQYNVNYLAVDECGKTKTCATSFAVFDTLAPVVVCRNDLIFDVLPPICLAQVWAVDFDNGSTDNCDPHLEFSFSPDNMDDNYRTFQPCELGQQTIEVWVTDNIGNQMTCQATFTIADNSGVCECDPLIGGKIEIDEGPDINSVVVKIEDSNGLEQLTTTDDEGNFFYPIFPGADYEITPEMDTLPGNGVSTFDFVLIRKHILSVDTLDSPYKIIAADVNNSGAVTTFDLVEIRKLILNISTGFTNNKSWRFVDAAFVFPNPMNPFETDFPESIIVNNVFNNHLGLDFIGIKVGDVNASANTSLLAAPKKQDDD